MESIIDKLDIGTLGFILLLIVFPGLVAMRIFRLFAAAKEDMDWRFPFYEPAFWGTINVLFAYLSVLVIWSVYYVIAVAIGMKTSGFRMLLPFDYPVESFIVLTGMAIVLPVLWIFLRKQKFIKNYILKQEPTAWDFLFANKFTSFVLVRLKNDTLIGGYFGTESFASRSPNKNSLYLERVVHINDNGEFIGDVPNSDGVLLRGEDIDYLEFFQIPWYNERQPIDEGENNVTESRKTSQT